MMERNAPGLQVLLPQEAEPGHPVSQRVLDYLNNCPVVARGQGRLTYRSDGQWVWNTALIDVVQRGAGLPLEFRALSQHLPPLSVQVGQVDVFTAYGNLGARMTRTPRP
jgi:hypothetical protein